MKQSSLLFHTIFHLKFIQVFFQIYYRLRKINYLSQTTFVSNKLYCSQFISKPTCLSGNNFCFIGLSSDFSYWFDTSKGNLWAYNLNYMDWLLQKDMCYEVGARWIDKFINDLSSNKIGLDPYPIALRGLNWIKFISLHIDKISSESLGRWNNSLYSQYDLLYRKLEYHLLGNHLLEDAYSLFVASLYFHDKKFHKKATYLLARELNEQILSDGCHYEQSPMYHCILLDRLLDCYNFSKSNIVFDEQRKLNLLLKDKAEMMLGYLEQILYADKTYPLFNDSAIGIAPTPAELFEYATRLEIYPRKTQLVECGYRHFCNSHFDGFIDVGNIKATYQPGHSHADTFNYELRVDGKPFIVDTGISTYNKTSRRQYERSTAAHNTVTINGRNSSEVWGGFRVGNRAYVTLLCDRKSNVIAEHDGFGKFHMHRRSFVMNDESFIIEDVVENQSHAISYIHFAPSLNVERIDSCTIKTDMATIKISGADSIEICDDKVSQEYNCFLESKVVKLHFSTKVKYEIR